MPDSDPQLLVSTGWLEDHLKAPDVKVVDATWRLPGADGDPRSEYEAAHIPGTVFFDISEVSDKTSALPTMLPQVEKFVSRVRAMGIGDGHRVVVYDQDGQFAAARVWWMFRVFGHRDVAVLDGGLKVWMAEGRPVEDLPPVTRDRHYTGRKDASLVRDVTQVAGAIKLGEEHIVDARSPARFRGDEPEPRDGMRAGHMPGAKNVHYASLLGEDGRMKPVAETRAIFEEAGVDLTKPIITTCGSGISAAILNLALVRLGHTRNSLYDGSWSEWGAYPDLPVERG
ncbi:MAG: 3-mercaptopyruvate sulfurtransferase [Pseudomonadota bacterium]